MSNLYGKSCTPNLSGVSDSYTKEEVNRLLSAKASTSFVYSRTDLDGRFSSLQDTVNSISSSYVTSSSLSSQLSSLESAILDSVSGSYYLQTDLYTKDEIDSLLELIDPGPQNYVKTDPDSPEDNLINPGSSDVTALTLRGSSSNPYVQKWLSNSTDVIGYVSNDGSVTFERELTLGRLMSNGSAALNLQSKRITGVAEPSLDSDAVNLKFLREFVLDTVDPQDPLTQSVADLITDSIASHVSDPNPHGQYALSSDLGNSASLDVGTTAGTVAAGDDGRFTTNLTYNPNTRKVESSTGTDAELPLVSTSGEGLQRATSFAAITYAAQVNLDFEQLDGQYRNIILTGNLELTTSNLAAGRMVVLRLVGDTSSRNLTFPVDWEFYSEEPTQISANKSAILSLTSFGTTNGSCTAVYLEQP